MQKFIAICKLGNGEEKMFIADACDVKQIFRNDFVDMVNRLVTDTEYYTFQLHGNPRSQGPDWYNQSI